MCWLISLIKFAAWVLLLRAVAERLALYARDVVKGDRLHLGMAAVWYRSVKSNHICCYIYYGIVMNPVRCKYQMNGSNFIFHKKTRIS
jgi:hypothetical protein